jgi:hypothetical protein
MRTNWLGLLLLIACMLPARATAQAAWDSPMMLPPNPPAGLGLYLTDMAGANIGFMASWHSQVWNYGIRAGIADGSGRDDLAVFGGLDYSGPITRATDAFPLDVDWVFGAGLGIGNGVRLSAPVGLSTGHTFRAEGAAFTPYLTPRVVLDGFFGGEGNGKLNLDLAVDLGLDLQFAGAGALAGATTRFGATLGRRTAIALGVVF